MYLIAANYRLSQAKWAPKEFNRDPIQGMLGCKRSSNRNWASIEYRQFPNRTSKCTTIRLQAASRQLLTSRSPQSCPLQVKLVGSLPILRRSFSTRDKMVLARPKLKCSSTMLRVNNSFQEVPCIKTHLYLSRCGSKEV